MSSEDPTKPRIITSDATFEIPFSMPPMPCSRCGADLRGKDAVLVDPARRAREDDPTKFAIAYKIACKACARKEGTT